MKYLHILLVLLLVLVSSIVARAQETCAAADPFREQRGAVLALLEQMGGTVETVDPAVATRAYNSQEPVGSHTYSEALIYRHTNGDILYVGNAGVICGRLVGVGAEGKSNLKRLLFGSPA